MPGIGPQEILTHAQRVCRLYKKALRTSQCWHIQKYVIRFNAAIIRARFDDTRKIQDGRVLAKMLEDAEREVWDEQHPNPFKFRADPDGICYNRECVAPDWVVDYWHPWERVQYLDYFKKREEMKVEYGDYYEKSITKKYQPEAPPAQ